MKITTITTTRRRKVSLSSTTSMALLLILLAIGSISTVVLKEVHSFTSRIVPHHNHYHPSLLSIHMSSKIDDDAKANNHNNIEDVGYKLIQKENYDIVQVELENNRDYPIYIGTGYNDIETSHLLQQYIQGNKVLIITNDKIASYGYLDHYKELLLLQQDSSDSNKKKKTLIVDTLVLPDGEKYKNLDILSSILDKCLSNQLDRKSTLIALGGGVIGDMVGFAASIYVRGIHFIQIPTSVMSMVDSSVGGKTGINHELGKNMIGSFHQPSTVFIDTNTLQTLPNRELYSGISEIIKYGLIRDSNFFVWLEENMDLLINRNPTAWRYAITRSCQNKASVVKADEKEMNDIRATLNLGHTFGHAIETGCGYGTYLHGEAVSIGIVMSIKLSLKLSWLSQDDVDRIISLLQRSNLPISLPIDTPMNRTLFLNIMSVDKKVTNGQLRLILLKNKIGNCIVTSDYDHNKMIEVIDEFCHVTVPTTPGVVEHSANSEQQQQQQESTKTIVK